MTLDVVAINIRDRKIVLDDGQILPMTNFLCGGVLRQAQDEGSEEGADVVICGPDSNGNWWAVDIDDFEVPGRPN